ncbi:MAG: hypothetical protein KKG60_00075 [Nanoarchaeota archaeon]|nr:hypothetical protein [Nanoarchaeota archaeon]
MEQVLEKQILEKNASTIKESWEELASRMYLQSYGQFMKTPKKAERFIRWYDNHKEFVEQSKLRFILAAGTKLFHQKLYDKLMTFEEKYNAAKEVMNQTLTQPSQTKSQIS